jgi:hypothetical protein
MHIRQRVVQSSTTGLVKNFSQPLHKPQKALNACTKRTHAEQYYSRKQRSSLTRSGVCNIKLVATAVACIGH